MNTNRIAIYARTSKDKEEEKTISQQIEEGINFSIRHDYEYEIYSDTDISGFDESKLKDRVGLHNLLKDAQDNKINFVWVYEQSRFARNNLVATKIMSELQKFKVKIYIKETLYDLDNSTDKLLLSMLNSFAEFDRNGIVDRTSRGQRASREKGIKVANALYGYRKTIKDSNNRYIWELVPEEAEKIKKIFEIYIKEKSINKIIQYFYPEEKISTTKDKWSSVGKLYRILNILEYTGKTKTPSGNIVPCITYPVEIVSYEDFQLVQSMLKQNNNSLRTHPNSKLLTGLISCSCCSERYYYAITTDRHHYAKTERYYYYKHSNLSKIANCTNRPLYVNQVEIDRVVLFCINKAFQRKDEIVPFAEKYIEENSRTNEAIDREIAKLNLVVNEAEKKIGKLLDAIEDSELSIDIKPRLIERKKERDEAVNAIEKLKDQKLKENKELQKVISNLSHDIFASFFKLEDNEKRKKITNYIKTMIIENGKLVLNFTFGTLIEIYLPSNKKREYIIDLFAKGKCIESFSYKFPSGSIEELVDREGRDR